MRLLTSPFCLVAEILYSLDRLSEAECLYRELIHRNPENYYYFEQLEKCLFLGESRSLEERRGERRGGGEERGEEGGGGRGEGGLVLVAQMMNFAAKSESFSADPL